MRILYRNYILLLLFLTFGCDNSHIQKAKGYSFQSKEAYQKAIQEYYFAIKEAKNKEALKLELARLYFEHKDYIHAKTLLENLSSNQARKLYAMALFESADYSDALKVFERMEEDLDDEGKFYYASTCEELNLYEKTVKLYEEIEQPDFKQRAEERLVKINLLDEGKQAIELSDIIDNSPSQEDFPQAGSIILLAEEDIKINPDNTAVYDEHFLIKILNERGKKDFSEIIIGYDSTYEKVELEFARTIKPDGTFVEVGDKNIRDVSKYLNYPLYSNARAFIISMPEVTNDCFVEYKAKIYRLRLIDEKHFISNYLVQINEPIQKATFSVTLPKDKELNLNILNREFNDFGALLGPQILDEGENTVYSWKFENIPQVIPEPAAPELSEITPIIQLSTFNSWEEIYNWWWPLVEDKIKINQVIKDKVKELSKDKKTALEKAQSIYNFCAQDIRYVAVEYGQAGFEPHSAVEVFQNKYGDCKDQAVLLITMLKEVGLNAYPVLIGTQGRIFLDEEFPTLVFNHAIAVLEYEGQSIFMDPTAETVSFSDLPTSDQDRRVLVITDQGPIIKEISLFSPSHNRVEYKTIIAIDKDNSIDADRAVLSFGGYDAQQRYYFRYTMPIVIKQNLQRKIQSICPAGVLEDYLIENDRDINKPIVLNYKFSGDDFLAKAGRLRVLPQLGSINLDVVVKDWRQFKIDFHNLEEIKTEIIFELPDNFKVKHLPPSLVYKVAWMDFSNDYKIEGAKLIFTEVKRVKQRYIDTEEYSEYKDFLEMLAKKLNERVILEVK